MGQPGRGRNVDPRGMEPGMQGRGRGGRGRGGGSFRGGGGGRGGGRENDYDYARGEFAHQLDVYRLDGGPPPGPMDSR